MERVAPRQIMYENQLPLAIESKSQRRLFFPEGGATYGPPGGANPNIVRIPINADSLLDVQHSYLQFTLNNTGGGGFAPDIGVPFIRRLRIESAGTTLEDIDNYGRLYGGLLFPAQASAGAVNEATIQTAGFDNGAGATLSATNPIADAQVTMDAGGAIAVGDIGGDTSAADRSAGIIATITQGVKNAVNAYNGATGVVGGRTINGAATIAAPAHARTNKIANGASVKYNVALPSALLNMEKYLPLVMMNAGIVLELEIDTARHAGVARAGDNNPDAGEGAPTFTLSDFRYVAHLIDLQRDFYDRMRMVMEGSGGVLQLAGTTFRHFQGNYVNAATTVSVNIPSRVKSIKSMFFLQKANADDASNDRFVTSNSVPNNIDEYQFRVGSVVYPPTSVKVAQDNKGEAYNELRKAFGNLGAYDGQGVMLNLQTYLGPANANFRTQTCAVSAAAAPNPILSPFGLDFESFQKIAAENGLNTADRALPTTLEIKYKAGGTNGTGVIDVYCMCDAIFYVNLDGSVSVSV
jgi:hypothetical protein